MKMNLLVTETKAIKANEFVNEDYLLIQVESYGI